MPARPTLPPVPFGEGTLDRADELRHDPDGLAAALARGGLQGVMAGPDGVLLDGAGLARIPVSDPGPEPIVLGLEDGRPLLAVPAPDGASLASLRDVATALDPAEAGLAAYLSALLHWHRTHPFCPACGGPTRVIDGGGARRCERCGHHHFPRTDPVVIMAVANGDRLLLGRRVGAPARRYSVLAGFVAPGETAEAAVRREVAEEAGIEVTSARYAGSQPWPFPGSLMLGFFATARDGQPSARDGELEDVRWVERAEVAAAAAGDAGLELPGPVSIARVLIDRWLEDAVCSDSDGS